MKKGSKVLIALSLCFITFGIMMMVGAGIAIRTTGANWYDHIDVYPARTQTHELNSITRLELELINEPVYIVRGGDTVTIQWSQHYDGQYYLSAKEGGTLSLSRSSHMKRYTRWFRLDFDWLGRLWGRSDIEVEDGFNRPVTVTIPEWLDLERIDLNGVDIRVNMTNIDAKKISANGVNAVLTFRHDDVSDYNYSTNGLGAKLRIDGRTHGSVGSSSYKYPGATREIAVNGLNAELHVYTE